MATLEETFQGFLDQLNTQISNASTSAELGMLQQQLERISKSIHDGMNVSSDLVAKINAAVPETRKINGMDLSTDVNLDYDDVSAIRNDYLVGLGSNVIGTDYLTSVYPSGDLNDVVRNSVFYCPSTCLNLPTGANGILLTFRHPTNPVAVQLLISLYGTGLFYRKKIDSSDGVWAEWHQITTTTIS